MKFAILKLVAGSVLLSLAASAMASSSGGTIHFTGSIVEPPCSTGSLDGGQVSIHCDKRSAFDVAFQRVGSNASSANTTITLTRDGKPLGDKEATAYRMALQGNSQLGLVASHPAAGSTPSPVIMTISYQ